MTLSIICCIILSGCSAYAITEQESEAGQALYLVSRITLEESEVNTSEDGFMKGIWISQFDMHPIFRSGGKMRERADYTEKVELIAKNLKRDGFNTVFLQLRPNGDSMYESEIYPNSKYIAGVYGGSIDYDAIEIFISILKRENISVHAWINPFRLCKKEELINYGEGVLVNWLNEGIGKRVEIAPNGILYLDPSYTEATDLIASGAKEILTRYDFDGIHLDDYFYPTEFEFDDEAEFLKSGFSDLGDFRRSNVNRTVKALYSVCKEFNKSFGISPAGNIYSLENGWYVDIYNWLSSEGFVDYIMPQLYFGFNNKACPFEQILSDWSSAVKSESVKLYIGLSAAKCALGTDGIEDKYAGESGKFEWRDNKDILARSLNSIYSCDNASGVCIFAYSSFYDVLNGSDNPKTEEEKRNFCDILKTIF